MPSFPKSNDFPDQMLDLLLFLPLAQFLFQFHFNLLLFDALALQIVLDVGGPLPDSPVFPGPTFVHLVQV